MSGRFRIHTSLALVLLLIAAACSADSSGFGTEQSGIAEGVVIVVDGTLGHVASFTVRMSDGLDATFVPADGVLFDDTAPIDHLRDHLANGDRVRVEYETLADGTKSAVAVGDE